MYMYYMYMYMYMNRYMTCTCSTLYYVHVLVQCAHIVDELIHFSDRRVYHREIIIHVYSHKV